MLGLLKSSAATAALALMVCASPVAAEEASSTLPGGASSLQEAYQDWSLACQGAPQIVCVVSQQQVQQNGQRVLAIELRRSDGDALSGNLIVPFGLKLEVGAALQIDDQAAQNPLRFSTCLPGGCLVPLDFDLEAIEALRAGSVLKVKVESIESKEVTLSISLRGLGAAIDRLRVLQSG